MNFSLGQRSFRVSPECEHSSAFPAALKSSWQENTIDVQLRANPRGVPLSVARRRADARISRECHCILIRSIK